MISSRALILAAGLAAAAAVSSPASAWTTVFSSSETASTANPSPAGSTGLGPLGAVGGIGGPVGWTAPVSGEYQIIVQDCCLVGDVYQTFVDGKSLGLTSLVPIGGPTNSSGTFDFILSAAGAHTFDINDQILSYIGSDSPYGGGVVGSIYTPAGLTVTIQSAPEPTTWAMMLIGFAGLGFAAYRKARPTAAVA
jgi:hypothetical protein